MISRLLVLLLFLGTVSAMRVARSRWPEKQHENLVFPHEQSQDTKPAYEMPSTSMLNKEQLPETINLSVEAVVTDSSNETVNTTEIDTTEQQTNITNTIDDMATTGPQELSNTTRHERMSNCTGSCGEGLSMFTVWTTPTSGWLDRYTFSIESAFFHHPAATITVYSSSLPASFFDAFTQLGYDIKVEKLDLKQRAKGTALEGWVANLSEYHTGPYYYAHLSDAVRLLVLSHQGGAYFDMDVIFLNPIDSLRNVVGWQDSDSICNAVMIFDADNLFVKECINKFADHYNVEDWAAPGPVLMTSIYQNTTNQNHTDANEAANAQTLFNSIHPLDTGAFFPVRWEEANQCFTSPHNTTDAVTVNHQIATVSAESYTLHFWNSQTHSLEIEKGSVLDRLFLANCVYCRSIVRTDDH